LAKPIRLAPLIVAVTMAGPACGATTTPDGVQSVPVDAIISPNEPAFVPTGIVGRWRFAAITGVPPVELPRGALPDNRHDLVISRTGTFRWGRWSGIVRGAGTRFSLEVTAPAPLAQRFDDYGAAIGILRDGDGIQIWLPDLGQDRDVDIGSAVEDIDPPDVAFVRGA